MKKIILMVVAFTIILSGCLRGTGSRGGATTTVFSGASTTVPSSLPTTTSSGGILSNLDLLKSGAAIKCKYKMDDTDTTIYMKEGGIRIEAKSEEESTVMIMKTLSNGSTEFVMQLPGDSNTWFRLITLESAEEGGVVGGVPTTGIDFTLTDITEMEEVVDDLDCSPVVVEDDYFELPADAEVIEDLAAFFAGLG